MTNRRTRWSQTAEESSAKRSLASDFSHLAGIGLIRVDVRFGVRSGHSHRLAEGPLCAKS